MDRYQLAKIVEWAGTLHSRKRMQKVVYLLQIAGCQLQADYILHHYGPYSQEVARLTDEMVRSGLLEETSEASPVGVQYFYRLPETTRRQIEVYERSPRSAEWRDLMAPFEAKAKVLIAADLKELEIAATLVYFFGQEGDWSLADEKTRQFKNLPAGSALLTRAVVLARQVVS
jgi:uncharacterized protein